jgi:hypothetical protein
MYQHCQEYAEWECMCLAEDWGQKGYEPRIHGKEGNAFVSSAAVSSEAEKWVAT